MDSGFIAALCFAFLVGLSSCHFGTIRGMERISSGEWMCKQDINDKWQCKESALTINNVLIQC